MPSQGSHTTDVTGVGQRLPFWPHHPIGVEKLDQELLHNTPTSGVERDWFNQSLRPFVSSRWRFPTQRPGDRRGDDLQDRSLDI
ncbi:hypothetical protein PGT21_015035 [Puccinia graminis f. sp. tritici]|uniref:Uncharacterized protein n=1 Tax=Puccinia graminis f. sp. tritici TaxID=56615 RepID=A0A5B0PXR4_PUCGR|nr:hypothetical protein PGT21_015035 [Puccinia graminis f. sp. tritici]